jgi:hypothetical protein
MLECEISGNTDRIYLHISWNPINKQYALGLRFCCGVGTSFISYVETIYLDAAITSLFFQRIQEAITLLNKFNNHEIKPLKNYNEAYQLSQMALNPQDRQNWGACYFDQSNL